VCCILQAAEVETQEQRTEKEFVGVLIPCYNEEKRIAAVIVGCQRFASQIYVCDDGSTDLTAEIASRMGAIVLKHKTNLGYGAALRTLFDAVSDSKLKAVATFDGDGQHDPECIKRLVTPILKKEADVVIGSRFSSLENKAEVPSYRKLGIKLITKMTNASASLKVSDSQSGLRAYDTRVLRKIMPSEMGMSASTEILMKAATEKMKIKEIPTTIRYYEDSSTHNPVAHGAGVLMGVVKQNSLKHPLLFYGLPGGTCLLISAVFWSMLLGSFARTKLIETNFAIMSVGFTIVGCMLATTAMILWTVINVVRSS
jgi:glycosyltransferase involved in cell wall biosynthesis